MEVRVSVESRSGDLKKGNSSASPSLEVQVKREINANMNKRFNESKTQTKAKAAHRGGVTASMIVLEPEAAGKQE